MTKSANKVVTKLVLNDFKCFQGIVEADLAPLTLIYGPNSSGKSSLIQAIQLISETVRAGVENDSYDRPRLSTTTPDRNLGGFSNIVSLQQGERCISIGYELEHKDLSQKVISPLTDEEIGIAPLLEELSVPKQVQFGFCQCISSDEQKGMLNTIEIKYGKLDQERITYRWNEDEQLFRPDFSGIDSYANWLTRLQISSDCWKGVAWGIIPNTTPITDPDDQYFRESGVLDELDWAEAPIYCSSYGLFAWLVSSTGKDPRILGIKLNPTIKPEVPQPKPAKTKAKLTFQSLQCLAANSSAPAPAENHKLRYIRRLYEAFRATNLSSVELATIVFSAAIPKSVFSRFEVHWENEKVYSDYQQEIYDAKERHLFPDPETIDANSDSELLSKLFSKTRLEQILSAFRDVTEAPLCFPTPCPSGISSRPRGGPPVAPPELIAGITSGVQEKLENAPDRVQAAERQQRAYALRDIACSCGPFRVDSISSYQYTEPIRDKPRRLFDYPLFPAKNHSNSFVDTIFHNQNDLAELNDRLRQMDLEYEVKVRDVSSPILGSYWTIMLKDLNTGCELTLCDVGYGISQLLPIIANAVYGKDGIQIVEQPELHLHPRLQAELGNLFADAAGINRLNRTNGRSCQWIVETHSELLLLRIRKLIKNSFINAHDVSVLYLQPTIKGTRIHQLRIGDDGTMLDDWPAGFFEDSLFEMEGLH